MDAGWWELSILDAFEIKSTKESMDFASAFIDVTKTLVDHGFTPDALATS